MRTIHEAFAATARTHADHPFLAVPSRAERAYLPEGAVFTYGETAEAVEALRATFAAAGYGHGHRVALLLENRPDHFRFLLALNALGVSAVPLNADLADAEIAWLLEHAEVEIIVAVMERAGQARAASGRTTLRPPVVTLDQVGAHLQRPRGAAHGGVPDQSSEAALMYTSGTTGRPKGCVLTNEYAFAVGNWYAGLGGRLALERGAERVFLPLPAFHINAGLNTPTALILTANCIVMPDRFHAKSFWHDLVETKATGMHYLGIMPPALLKAPPCAEECQHAVKFGLGAGIDPSLHAAFEERFGIAMVEVWGMTETGRFLADNIEPRQIGTRAFGRPWAEIEGMVGDEAGREVARDAPGELLVRRQGDNPRAGFFAGYLKDDEATESAWRGGWFHTGDVVTQDATGMFHFVERRKNIIRRSGENISAAEVEAALITHDAIAQVSVLAVEDEMRDEEVMACVVLAPGTVESAALATEIADWARGQLAYYKPPGWVVFVDELPVTSTQKVQKALIFPEGTDPRTLPRAHDLRGLKQRVAR